MNRSLTQKNEILKRIVILASRYNISAKEITSELASSTNTSPTKDKIEVFMKLFAYLGGIFIFSGLTIYIGTFWTTMGSLARITLTLGTGIVLQIFSFLIFFNDKKNKALLTPIILLAAFFQACGLFVAVHEFKQNFDFRFSTTLIFAIMLIQQMLLLIKLKIPVLIFTSTFFWCTFLLSFLDLLLASDETTGIIMGLSLFYIAYILDKKNHKSIANFWYFIGTVLFLNALFDLVKGSYFEVIFPALSAGLLYLSTILKNKIMLFTSTLSLLSYIGYFTYKHFVHSSAWPLLLVVVGCVCIGIGIMTLKFCKKYMN